MYTQDIILPETFKITVAGNRTYGVNGGCCLTHSLAWVTVLLTWLWYATEGKE